MDNENLKFYIVDGLASANPDKNLKSESRIIAIPDNFPYILTNDFGHNSIRHLRRYNQKWKYLKSIQSKTADKICEENFILYCHDFVLTPHDIEFNKYSFDLLQHAIYGKYDSEFSGLHLISSFNKEIESIEQVKPEDINGVWEAKVVLYNKRRNKHYIKTSTFFPKTWTPSHFMFESFAAIKSIQINSNETEYLSKTQSGIPVVIIIKNNRAKTIYPLYQDSKSSN